MDLRDQLKNLFPTHEEQDFEMPTDEKDVFKQREPLVCKFGKKGRNRKYVTLIKGWKGDGKGLKGIFQK